MKVVAAAILFIVLVLVGTKVYSFFMQEQQLSGDLADIEARLTKAQYDETNLRAQVKYLANPLNLEKELRARFNYKKPGETMIIIVPEGSSTAPSSVND